MLFEEACEKALSFREDRDWKQFHNPKDLAMSISIEAAELLETFQWSGEVLTNAKKLEQMEEELADVMIYCIYFAESIGANIPDIISQKISQNQDKYPVEKAKGTSRKYTEL